MDMNMLLQAVGTVGFPICMCGAMFWYMTKQTETHKEEVAKMTEALNNNTIALSRLEVKMGADKNECNS